MASDDFWKPDKPTQAAIRRGDKKLREWYAERAAEYERERIAREAWREHGNSREN